MIRSLPLLAIASCAPPTPSVAAPAPPAPPPMRATRSIALPGGAAGVGLDYLAYDPVHHRVWVPAGGTGKVDVIDARTLQLTAIDGFATKEVERRGKKHVMGPSTAAVGDGVVYIGDRADASVCAFDSGTLVKRACGTLATASDGLVYVASRHELWVTTPHDQAIVVLDARTLATTATIRLDGDPEGYAVDEAHGRIFTNLEDKDRTLVLDLASHAITQTWEPKCGEDGPKGLIFDPSSNHLVVVCPDHLETLDEHGAIVGTLQIGDGLDNIDFLPARHQLVAAAGEVGTLVLANLAADGALTVVATLPTAKGARNAVVAEDGTVFIADGPAGSILVVPAR